MTTSIRPCTCEHVFQDKTYGSGMRVFNRKGRKEKAGWRCSVCGRVVEVKKYEVVDVQTNTELYSGIGGGQ